MKKYILMLPVVLFPYIVLFGVIALWKTLPLVDALAPVGGWVILGLVIAALADAVIGLIVSRKRSGLDNVKLNLFIKCAQIPAYCAVFLLALLGFFMSVFAIGVWALCFLLDALCISFTGLNAIGAARSLYREGTVSRTAMVLIAIGGFVFIADVVLAIVMHVLCRKKSLL